MYNTLRLPAHLVAIFAFSATTYAFAQPVTAWHETMGGDVRIVLESTPNGASGQLPKSVRGAIEIDLAPGWHTYWRDPGASGIPPTFVLSDTSQITNVSVDYPAPVWVEMGYGSYAGYTEPLSLPFQLDTGGKSTAAFSGELILGVCEDICIPVVVPFDLMIKPSASSSKSDLIVAKAFSGLPAEAPDELVSVAMNNKQITITIDESKLVGNRQELPNVFAAIDGMNMAKPKLLNRSASTLTYVSTITYSGDRQGSLVVNVTTVYGVDAYNARLNIAR